jgi:D-alanyl-lipoteichoic acid acyltransferase DltB (MBOAT superfamily)
MNTLSFADISFWLFFAFVLLGLSLFYNRLPLRNGFLFLCNIIFYFLVGGWLMLSVLLFSIIINYLFGLSRHWFSATFAITINISLYILLLTQEFPTTVLGSALPVLSILPFGVSFYTFAAISYIVDVHKRRINPVRNFIDLGFFLSFFPVAAAGPVLRATDFIPQLRKFYQVTSREFSMALLLILGGLIKIAIANFIAIHFDLKNWLSIYGYAVQIYCIFSGYTNIAIGVAMLLGFKIPPNFNSPYKATSLIAFCSRWYISFFVWLRDYIYIPLGGKKRRQHTGVKKSSSWIRLVGFLLTFNVICFMWIILRAETFDNAVLTIQQLFIPATFSEITNNVAALSLAAAVLILHFLPERTKNSCKEIFYNTPIVIKFLITLVVVAIIYLRF